MPILSLKQRLAGAPVSTPGFAYHVTHGIRLASIRRSGLLPGKPGVQYRTNEVFYGTNLKSLYSAYGTTVVSRMTRYADGRWVTILGPIGYNYFQGVSVLRTPIAQLQTLGFISKNQDDWSGPKVPPAYLELFIDNTWKPLQTVELGVAQMCWRAIYHVTPFLRD